MSINYLFKLFRLVLILMTAFIGNAQEKYIELTGTVQSLNNNISNVLITNISNHKTTRTNAKGFFTIEVKLNDTIQFSAVNFIIKKISVSDRILNQKIFVIDLKENVIDLNEVVVLSNNFTGYLGVDFKKIETKPAITSLSLGIIKAEIKAKTKNERLLFEADGGKLIDYGAGFSMDIYKLTSKLSGKTKKLRNRVLLERKIKTNKDIIRLFSKKTLSEELNIPDNKIVSFLNYCINQPDFPKSSEVINALQILEYYFSKSDAYKKANGLN